MSIIRVSWQWSKKANNTLGREESMSQKATYRFDIVVINHGKLFSFINNIHKLKGLGDRDRITVISSTPSDEERTAAVGLTNGRYFPRQNHGMNSLPTIQYIMCQLGDNTNLDSEFLFVLQEHHLDTESAFSKWGAEFDFRIKGDVIADGAFYDLDDLECKYAEHPDLIGAYCDRRGPERFHLFDGRFHIVTNGTNFILRTEKLKRPEIQRALAILLSEYPGDKDHNDPKNNCEWVLIAEYLFGPIFFGESETHYDVRRAKFIHSFNDQADFNDTPDYMYERLQKYKSCIQTILALTEH
jgi:hypothetical protein